MCDKHSIVTSRVRKGIKGKFGRIASQGQFHFHFKCSLCDSRVIDAADLERKFGVVLLDTF